LQGIFPNLNQIRRRVADIAWSFLQNSLRSLAGNFRAEFDPEQGIRIPEQGIWRPPRKSQSGETFVGRRMGTSATRIYAPISITNPPASLAPPFGSCQRRGVQSSKPAKPMIKPMILCAPCDKIQSGDGCVANIGGFPAESSWRAIRATSRPNSTGSFAW
jgi:hypothetical protein